MKKAHVLSLILLVISLFVTIDLSINLFASLIPSMNDGIGNFSLLHALFGIFGDSGWSHESYYHAWQISLWISFLLVIINIALLIYPKKAKQK